MAERKTRSRRDQRRERENELRRLRDAGYPAVSLVAYGPSWYTWYMRRLAERPANVIFALRQVIP